MTTGSAKVEQRHYDLADARIASLRASDLENGNAPPAVYDSPYFREGAAAAIAVEEKFLGDLQRTLHVAMRDAGLLTGALNDDALLTDRLGEPEGGPQ